MSEMSGKMVSFDIEIKGVTSLLQHRFGEAAEASVESETRTIRVARGTPREEAEKVCYRDKNGYLWHPGAAIARGLREVGSGHKQRGSRKSLKYIIPAAVLVMDDAVGIFDDEGQRIKDYEVDSRPVVIPATKGRVMRHRPRLDVWRMRFTLRINTTLMDEDTVHLLLDQMGQQNGVGDFRPEKGGPFGTFVVTKWEARKN